MKSFLQYLYESKSPLLDELEAGFSDIMVYDGRKISCRPDPSVETCQTIYRIVNKWLFGSRLRSDIRINVINPGRSILPYAANYSFMTAVFVHKITGREKIMLVDSNGKINRTAPEINICLYKKPTLMYIVNLMAHEMIHQYDVENGAALDEMLSARNSGNSYNPHGTVFQKFMNDANKFFGLSIGTTSAGIEIEQMRAAKAAREMNGLKVQDGEYDLDDIEVLNEYERAGNDLELKIDSVDYSSFEKIGDIYKIEIS